MDMPDMIVFWHWLIVAVVLISLEMIAPATFFLWMGFAAVFTGVMLFVVPDLPLLIQVIIFTVVSAFSLVAYKKYLTRNPVARDEPMLNRRQEQYVGRSYVLAAPIINGVGSLKIDDSTWKVSGADLAAGSRVCVVTVEDTTLIVEAE